MSYAFGDSQVAGDRLEVVARVFEPPTSAFLDRHLIESRTLLLFGPVTDQMASVCATRLTVMERMDAERPITVMINSPGGSADSGFAIYDMLRFVSPPVCTVVPRRNCWSRPN